MKVLHIIASMDPRSGGPAEGVTQIGNTLHALDVEQHVLTLDAPGSPFEQVANRYIYPMGRPRCAGRGPVASALNWANYSPAALDWGRTHLRDFDACVVNGLWNYSTRIARQLLVGSGVPYVVYPHGMLDPWFRSHYPMKHVAKQLLWTFNEGVLLREADAVLFTCEEERLLARKTFMPYSVRERVIAYGAGAPPPPDPDQITRFRALLPALGERPYILFLSRIHEKKGCDLLVEAFAKIAVDHPGLDLVIAGPDQAGLADDLRARASKLGISDRIHWPGMVGGAAKYGAFRGARAFVLPSHQENFGIVVAEALACECPVLISDKVNIWREVETEGAGIVAPDTAEGTLSLLRRFLALDAASIGAMVTCGKRLFDERFNTEAAARDLVSVLSDLKAGQKLPRWPAN